jgi:hypothetical protein
MGRLFAVTRVCPPEKVTFGVQVADFANSRPRQTLDASLFDLGTYRLRR